MPNDCPRFCVPISEYNPEIHTLIGTYATAAACSSACACDSSAAGSSDNSDNSDNSDSSNNSSSSSSGSSNSSSSSAAVITNCIGTQSLVQTNIGSTGQRWEAITYGNGIFVAGGETTGESPSVMYSANGISWQAGNLTAMSVYDMAFNGSFFLAKGGNLEELYKSTNGSTWTELTFSGPQLTGLMTGRMLYLGGRFVAINNNFNVYPVKIATSTDGETWTSADISNDPADGAYIKAGSDYKQTNIVYANNKYYILGFGAPDGTTPPVDENSAVLVPVVAISEDNCATWSIQTVTGLDNVPATKQGVVGASQPITYTTYGNGKFVAIFDLTTFQTGPTWNVEYRTAVSTDGINWTNEGINTAITSALQPLLGPGSDGSGGQSEIRIRELAYLNNQFTAVAGGQISYTCEHVGKVLCSTDGLNWATSSANNGNWVGGITYGNGRYVAAGVRRFTGQCESENTPDILVGEV